MELHRSSSRSEPSTRLASAQSQLSCTVCGTCRHTDNRAFFGLFRGFRSEAYLKIAMISRLARLMGSTGKTRMNMELSGRRKPTPEKSHRLLKTSRSQNTRPSVSALTRRSSQYADNEPVALVVRDEPDSIGATDMLPFGPFNPREHRTLKAGSGPGFTTRPAWNSAMQSSSTRLPIADGTRSQAIRRHTSFRSAISR